jgi:Zn-dependent metalloprotease
MARWRSVVGPRYSSAVLLLVLANCGYETFDPASSSGTSRTDPALRSIGEQRELAGAPRTPGVALVAGAIDALRARRVELGLSSTLDDFAVLSSHHGLDGLDHVRLQQMHRGVPVWGADVVVHASADTFHGVGGKLASIADLDPVAGVASELSIETVKADRIRAAISGEPPVFGGERHELVILPVAEQPARLTWHVSLFTDNGRGTQPAWWNYFIDAHDGSVVYSYNGLETVVAQGPGGNARVSREWSGLSVTQSGSLYLMSTPALETHDNQHRTLPGGACNVVHQCASKGAAAFDVDGNGVFQSSDLNFPDAAGNDAHGFGNATLLTLSVLGLNSINNAGFQITNHVHYGTGFANAFWNPGDAQLYFGDGDGVSFYAFSGAVEVVAHEIHHGFTEFHSNLQFGNNVAGGLNESFSDIAGATVSFVGTLDPTFDFGKNIMVQPNVALRYMCNPPRDGVSIDNAANFITGMDPHYSSGVMNKAFCRAAKRISGVDPDAGEATSSGVIRAAQAWYAANMSYWTSTTSSFADACQGVMTAAEALGLSTSDTAAIGRSWQDVGVSNRFPVAWLAGNMDADQKTDLIEVFDNGVGHAGLRTYRSTGTGYVASFSSSDLGQPSTALAWLTGTVNTGDQLTDIIQLSNNAGQLRITVYRSTGSGYILDSVTDTGRSPAALAWLTGDVDHDGRTDIIQPFDNAGRLGIAVYSPGATGYHVNTVTPDLGQGAGALAWLTGHMTDQMSTDVIQPFDSGGNLGLLVYKWTTAGYATAFGSSNMGHPSLALNWLAVDVTHNGRTSIVQIAPDAVGSPQFLTYVSNGTGYSLSSVGGSGRFDTPLTWLTGDVDGDGATDVIEPINNNGALALIVYLWNGVAYQMNSITPFGTTTKTPAWFTGSMTGNPRVEILEPFYTISGVSPTLGLDVYRVNTNGIGYNLGFSSGNLGPVN